MKPLKTKVSITLDETIVEEIKRYAEEDDRSISSTASMSDTQEVPLMLAVDRV